MGGRHRPAGLLRRRGAYTPLVVAAVLVVATGTILAVQSFADAGGCGETTGTRLPVAADPAIAPALREIADEWVETAAPELNGGCVAVEVTEQATADTASLLAGSAGGFVDVATPAPVEGEVPAVWVPDSSYWLARMREVSRTALEPDALPLAASPIVLGANPAAAELLGGDQTSDGGSPDGPVAPADLREPLLGALSEQQRLPVTLAEPRRDTAGLVGAGWLQEAVVTAEDELPNVVAVYRGIGEAPTDSSGLLAELPEDEPMMAPVSEQAISTHLQNNPATVTAVPVADAPALDFPYAILANQPRDIQTAATMFRDALTGAGDVFARHGFQPVDENLVPVGPPERVTETLRIWTSATRDARVLSVVNVNASMAEPMVTADGTEVPRITVFQQTALEGMPLFTDGTDLGHWEYAAGLDGDQDWVEGEPIDTLTPEHRQAVEQAVQSVQVASTDEAALFETLLAAYQTLKEGYDPSRSNTLIMWTDGGSGKAGGLSLEETLTELERLADVTRPIRVILLGLGPDADMDQLEAIADTTGGGAFPLDDPDQIGLVFLRALLT